MLTASMGNFKTTHYEKDGVTYTYQEYDVTKDVGERLAFFFFVFLWTSEFVTACGILIIACAMSHWYFTKPEERDTFTYGTKMLNNGYFSTLRWYDYLPYTIQNSSVCFSCISDAAPQWSGVHTAVVCCWPVVLSQ
jgi:hypothetical protein